MTGWTSLSSFTQLDNQLLRLSKANTIPVSVLENHLDITLQLLGSVRQRYPHCLLVPFGSIITGLATEHSDSDLCLVPYPTTALVQLLTGRNYFTPCMLSMISYLEAKYNVTFQPPAVPPPSAATPLSNIPATPLSLATPLSNTYATPPTYAGPPLPAQAPELLTDTGNPAGSEHVMLSDVRWHVKGLEGCSRIRSLPHARCPILLFRHDPTSLDFDVCIDNL
jgi:predicted nucleotidyltransferase